jgi:hypothetical protein
VADSAAATDSRDLLERLMIAFKYISAELDPYIAQVLAPPSPPSSLLLVQRCRQRCSHHALETRWLALCVGAHHPGMLHTAPVRQGIAISHRLADGGT